MTILTIILLTWLLASVLAAALWSRTMIALDVGGEG